MRLGAQKYSHGPQSTPTNSPKPHKLPHQEAVRQNNTTTHPPRPLGTTWRRTRASSATSIKTCFCSLAPGQRATSLRLGGARLHVLFWSVENRNESGEPKYPLSPFPEFNDVYYDLELHVARDFVYHTSELIDPFGQVVCPCGRDLRFSEWDKPLAGERIESHNSAGSDRYTLSDTPPKPPLYDFRIYRFCPTCDRPFRPQDLVARVKGCPLG